MQSPKPIGQLVLKNIGKKIAAQGFAQSDLLMAWNDIVGEDLAPFCRPLSLKWPKAGAGENRKGKLVVEVLSGYQVDVSMMTPVILERIATRLGWRAVESIKIEVGIFTPVYAPQPRAEPPKVALKAHQSALLEGFEDEALKSAVQRLGEYIAGERGK